MNLCEEVGGSLSLVLNQVMLVGVARISCLVSVACKEQTFSIDSAKPAKRNPQNSLKMFHVKH